MSSSSQGRDRLAAHIPESLRAVLTSVQQFLLMDTVLVVSVNDLRRALCDAEFAEQLVRRPEPAPPVQQRAFTTRPASTAELAAAEQRALIAADAAARQAVTDATQFATHQQRVARERREAQQREESRSAAYAAEAEAAERRRMAAEAAVERSRAATAEADRRSAGTEAALQQRQQEVARRTAANRQRPPNQRQPNSGSPQPFSDAIRNMAQPTGYQAGHVPVLGGQSDAREESLAQARANRVPVDWNSETMWRLLDTPRNTVPIAAMADQQLVNEIAGVISDVFRVFEIYAENNESPAAREYSRAAVLLAKRWLAGQTAFRALVQEAVRRNVRLSSPSNLYIRQFVLGASSNAQLADFVNHPVRVVTEESVVDTFGRSGRALRLDDD